VACFGLTRELTKEGIDVIFVLPRQQPVIGTPRFVFADLAKRVKLKPVDSALKPYQGSDSLVYYQDGFDDSGKPIIKCRTVMEEVHRFAHQASLVAQAEEFDIIHAHDWSSYLAGVAAKVASGKPLILHVHATSFDQAASNNVDPAIFQIEKKGFGMADKVVTVSGYTRDLIIEKHGVDPSKVEVVHNGCEQDEFKQFEPGLSGLKAQGYKIVLYHGRITIQKGVDYFVKAARKVIDIEPKTIFVISGWGDMTNQIIEEVGQLGLSKHFIFAGSLWEDERDRMYQTADLVVMPSVSEPFGLVPLEALQQGTASLISKQSGVAEVLKHVLKVDFWDVDEMANQILSALRYPAMRRQIVNEGRYQLSDISWSNAARKIKSLYHSLLQYVTS
jgi:glycogen(starch) synthase